MRTKNNIPAYVSPAEQDFFDAVHDAVMQLRDDISQAGGAANGKASHDETQPQNVTASPMTQDTSPRAELHGRPFFAWGTITTGDYDLGG